jgi:hypothetical protein
MVKKPTLALVEPDDAVGSPPRKLGAHGMALWNKVNADYRIDDAGGIELLAQACAGLDRAEAVIYTKSGPKAHPAIREETALRSFVCRTLQRLGLNIEVLKPTPGRPAGWGPSL